MLAMFVCVDAPLPGVARGAGRLLTMNEHEGRAGPSSYAHAHAQPPRSLPGLVVPLALAHLVDPEQQAEERQAREDDAEHRAYYHTEGHTLRRDDSVVLL